MSLCLKYDPIGRRVDFSERQRALRAKKGQGRYVERWAKGYSLVGTERGWKSVRRK